MVDTFSEISGLFKEHAMESMLCDWRTFAVCKVGFAGRRHVQGFVSLFWNQPNGWLQMEGSICAARPAGSPRWFASAPPLAATDCEAVVELDWAAAPPSSVLGCAQDSWMAEATLSPGWSAVGADDSSVAQENETGEGPAAETPRPLDGAGRADPTPKTQSGMDDRLQGVVSHWGWAASRAVDGARSVQPVWFGGQTVEESALEASSSRLGGTVPTLRSAGGDSRRQRNAVWIDGTSGLVAFECLVDRLGDSSGIHRSRSSRAKWSARTISSRAEKRNNTAASDEGTSSAASQQRMVGGLQPNAPARGTGTAHTCLGVSTQSSALYPEAYRMEVCSRLGNATSAKQWRGQMERKETIFGGGLCRDAGRVSEVQAWSSHGLSWWSDAGSDARSGRRRAPAYGLRPSTSTSIESKSVNHVHA
jgi:hypothetical protein